MPGRQYSATTRYRYGFNGKENDNEVKGEGDQQDYGMRIFDPRLGRFLSVDPLMGTYPWYTPYQFAGNIPTKFIDADGLEPAQPKFSVSLPFFPPANARTPLGYMNYELAHGVQKFQQTRTGKFINGLWNTAAGTVGMTASVSYMIASDGTGAILGGSVAFDLSAGTTSIGIAQMIEALSKNNPDNQFLHDASNIPGLIAFAVKSKNAELIDALGGLLPTAFTSGNGKSLFSLTGLVKSGFGFVDAIKEFGEAPSVRNAIGLLDSYSGLKGVTIQSVKLSSRVWTPSGANAALNSNPRLTQFFDYTFNYTIQSGDNLTKIASMFGTSIDKIAKDNNIQDVNKINAGSTLKFSEEVIGDKILYRGKNK